MQDNAYNVPCLAIKCKYLIKQYRYGILYNFMV